MAMIKFYLNNVEMNVDVDPSKRLIDFLREDMHLTGTKEGCGEGSCGACVVLFDHKSINSCLLPMANVMNHSIITIEEFKKSERFNVLKECFAEEGGSQCGFCTPGMIIAAESLLNENAHPTEEEVRHSLSGNLCRCTGYQSIVKAVLLASKLGDGIWDKK